MSEGLTMSQLQERNALLVTENEALQAERDALAVECTQYKSLAERFAERADDYKSGHFGYSVFDSSNEFKQHIKTPATDAYLNSVRAEAVQKLWNDSLNDVGHMLRDIGAFRDASGAAGIVHDEIKERVEEFAAQLRAGKDGE